MKDVTNKVAFITGGASGIGLGMAHMFLRAGMKVVVADVHQSHLEEARQALASYGPLARFTSLDVRDRSAFARAAEETIAAFGKVHVLCNNAGVSARVRLEQATFEDWDRLLSVNLGGVINGVVTFLPRLMAHREGAQIVNTSSIAGLLPMPDTGGLYSTSKFAVRGLSESLRLSLAPHGIGVSVLCPGLTRTRLLESEGLRAADLDAGMDPLQVGARVLEGIRCNTPYILTHGEFTAELRESFDEIIAACPRDDVPDAGRLLIERLRRERTAAARARSPR
jgi:NAD(P)-dependent dehydrogenase (short-subunit alcohol dehydrogenase family)